MLKTNECDCQNQQERLQHGCFVAFFFSTHCSLGTFHFFLLFPASGPATGSFNGFTPKANS
jgi:hypothetical protein